jgi:hypothetical protein
MYTAAAEALNASAPAKTNPNNRFISIISSPLPNTGQAY